MKTALITGASRGLGAATARAFAAAGWANDVPEIESFMRRHCKYYFKTVQELDRFLEANV